MLKSTFEDCKLVNKPNTFAHLKWKEKVNQREIERRDKNREKKREGGRERATDRYDIPTSTLTHID